MHVSIKSTTLHVRSVNVSSVHVELSCSINSTEHGGEKVSAASISFTTCVRFIVHLCL